MTHTNFNTEQSIYETWRECNKDNLDIPAIEYFGRQWTFREADEMIDGYARAFLALGIPEGRSVTFCVPTLPSTIFAFYALNKLGIRANFVSDALLRLDVREYTDGADADALFILDRFYSSVGADIAKTSLKNIIIVSLADDAPEQVRPALGGFAFWNTATFHGDMNYLKLEKFIDGGTRTGEIESVYRKGDTAVVLYTGGSTGIPKGIELTDEAAIRMSGAYLAMDFARVGDRNLILIPPNHPTSFMLSMVVPWNLGVTQVLQPIYNKNTFLDDLRKLKPQVVAVAAPSHYATLLLSDLKEGDLSTLRLAGCGGEAVTYEFAVAVNTALKKAGVIYPYLVLGYGMSELGSASTVISHKDKGAHTLFNKVGKTLPGVEGRIVDDNGNILGDNSRGNLEIKSPWRMKGYYKQPELTTAFFTEDGFAKTGDIAIRDENGYYDVLGRASDSFITPDGETVYLFDIERVVYKEKAVAEAEVIGLDGKIPLVHIVLNAGYSDKAADVIGRIHNLCNKHLREVELPQGYKIRESFGTNPISTKRDYKALLKERDGYVMPDGNGGLRPVAFSE
jgi:long-chain acyl-CoA synthetase